MRTDRTRPIYASTTRSTAYSDDGKRRPFRGSKHKRNLKRHVRK